MTFVITRNKMILDTSVSYPETLRKNLAKIQSWRSSVSLETATRQVNSMLPPNGEPFSEDKVDVVVQSWINSMNNSLNRPWNPNYVPMKKEGVLYKDPDEKTLWVKGLVVKGHNPYRNPIRMAIAKGLDLQMWIKAEAHALQTEWAYETLDDAERALVPDQGDDQW